MLSKEILSTLKKLYQKINNKDILWFLSGSTSLAIQGVDVEAHDIDIVTNIKGSRMLDELLAEFRIESPRLVKSEKIKSYWGIYKINGVKVETIADFQYYPKDGAWPDQFYGTITKKYKGMILPMLPLEKELIEYENLGRTDKVEKIKKTFNQV